MRILALLFSLLFAFPAYSQAWKDRLSPEKIVRKKQRRDSAEQVFYQQPPYLLVSYYQNNRLIPWKSAMTLYVEINHQKTALKPSSSSSNSFLLPPLDVDSLIISFEYKGKQLVFGKAPMRYFAHGATIDFGFIDRAHIKQDSLYEDNPPEEILR